jgi:polyhydroxyalkanoate synthesis repressor PhaR
MLVKKYGNRRLYDTEASRYITLEDLTAKIREGSDVRVVDARSSADLTQETLTQIIIGGRGAEKILPASLLHRLIRLRDDALADFLGRYVEGALELYLQARKTSQSLIPLNPMLALFGPQPFTPAWPPPPPPPQPSEPGLPASTPPGAPPQTPPPPPTPPSRELQELRRELDELKAELHKRKK